MSYIKFNVLSKSEQLLAALVLVLWSLGTVLLPALHRHGVEILPYAAAIEDGLVWLYFALHAVIFAFAGYTLVMRLYRGHRKNRGLMLLYVYTLATLGFSVYIWSPLLLP